MPIDTQQQEAAAIIIQNFYYKYVQDQTVSPYGPFYDYGASRYRDNGWACDQYWDYPDYDM
jgi:hypothetical protein